MKTVLIIDDSTYIRTQIKDTVENAGFNVIGEARSGESGIDLALEHNPDVITLDNVLPDMNGIDVLHALIRQNISSKIIMVSAVGKPSAIQEALASGAAEYIVKPFNPQDLSSTLAKACP